MTRFKVWTLDQVRYDPRTDRKWTLEEGLEREWDAGWRLVGCFTDPAVGGGVVQFIFASQGRS